MRPLVKICGLTRAEDACLAVQLGATHLGSVMVSSSPRCASPEQAVRVLEATGGNAHHVLIFKREELDRILEVAGRVGTTHVQLYDMSESDALALEKSGLSVYRVHDLEPGARELPPLRPEPSEERPAILDVGGGGSGTAFSWEILGGKAPHATFIAGGVCPENIAALVKHHPFGVDLSSGVETEPGIKDHRRLELFFENLEKSL